MSGNMVTVTLSNLVYIPSEFLSQILKSLQITIPEPSTTVKKRSALRMYLHYSEQPLQVPSHYFSNHQNPSTNLPFQSQPAAFSTPPPSTSFVPPPENSLRPSKSEPDLTTCDQDSKSTPSQNEYSPDRPVYTSGFAKSFTKLFSKKNKIDLTESAAILGQDIPKGLSPTDQVLFKQIADLKNLKNTVSQGISGLANNQDYINKTVCDLMADRDQMYEAVTTLRDEVEINFTAIQNTLDLINKNIHANNKSDSPLPSNPSGQKNDPLFIPTEELPQVPLIATCKAPPNLTLVPNVPTFSGSYDDLDIQRLFEQLENAASLSNWTEEDMVVVFQLRITGAAKLYFDTFKITNPQFTYSTLKQNFIKRFKSPTKPHHILKSLTTFQPNPTDPLKGTVDRINNLVAKLSLVASKDPQETFSLILDHLALEAFLTSLPTKSRDLIRSRTPKTFNEAVELATTYQEVGLSTPDPEPQKSIFYTSVNNKETKTNPKPLMETHYKSHSYSKPFPVNPNKIPRCEYCPTTQFHWHSDCPLKTQPTSKTRYNRNSSQPVSPNKPFHTPRSFTLPHTNVQQSSHYYNKSSPQKQYYPYRQHQGFPNTYINRKSCQICSSQDHLAGNCDKLIDFCRQINNNQTTNKYLVPRCSLCHKQGHIGINCRSKN